MSVARAPRRPAPAIRPATAEDADFILSLTPRFVAFDLPKGRRKRDVLAAIQADITKALHAEASDAHRFFVAEDAARQRAGFIQLQRMQDFFSGARSCHVSDLAIAPGRDGQGLGRALLDFAETWARKQGCAWLSLAVFPGNARARALYERRGFSTELLRMSKPLRPRR